MKNARVFVLVCLGAAACLAQMTPDQKAFDFMQLAGTYAMNYGPVQWKRDAFQFDLLKIGDWLTQSMNTENDLDFYELCVSYVASLNDAHDAFVLPSDFVAQMGFDVDLYDGKAIIEYIDRRKLPSADFPFQVGDELVSMDGVSAGDLIQQLSKYSIAANPLSTRRIAAWNITYRPQSSMPHAHLVPDVSTVVVNLRNGGMQSFSVPWTKDGTPITMVGPVVSPFSSASAKAKPAAGASASEAPQDYMRALRRLRTMSLPLHRQRAVLGFGDIAPVFQLPANFVQRMGNDFFDSFYSGTFQAQGLTIGYIRIPSFDYYLSTDDFQTEIDYMKRSTDGLIVDVMRNPGGDLCTAEDLLERLINTPFHNAGLEIRATRGWLVAFEEALQYAKDSGAPDDVVTEYQTLFDQVNAAFLTPSGRTPPLPVCDPTLDIGPATDRAGNVIAYDKPVMLLVDEMSASAADYFSAVFQDSHRGRLFGMRTMGAGGNVDVFPATTYSEGQAYVTESLISRAAPVQTAEYPTAPYIENIGVRPEVVKDYMTLDNLLNKGAAFVQSFSDSMVEFIQASKVQDTERIPAGATRSYHPRQRSHMR